MHILLLIIKMGGFQQLPLFLLSHLRSCPDMSIIYPLFTIKRPIRRDKNSLPFVTIYVCYVLLRTFTNTFYVLYTFDTYLKLKKTSFYLSTFEQYCTNLY